MKIKLFILIFGGLTLGTFTKGCGKANKAEKPTTEQQDESKTKKL
ncbi:MAG: hypothetical protein ACOYMA_05245 [Bacteroidia bacterium]